MGVFDLVRRLSPTQRLIDAEREVWASAPSPAPFPPTRPATPPIDWQRDQPPPPPTRYVFTPGYSDHTYQQLSAPLGFEGFGLDRIRSAVASHRLGYFFESSALMVATLGFAPVLAALQQAIAPILALPRHVQGGDSPLSRFVTREVEESLGTSRGGLLPSAYFSPTLWGTMAIYLRMLGFAVLQHVDGDMDPVTGVRPRYTRIWEPWAVNMYRSPRKVVALAKDGHVEICNDGKFTLVADEQEPHLTAAILALGEEAFAGRITQEARLSFLDFFGKPKLWAQMPERVATNAQAGDQFFAAVETIRGPDGYGVLPNGATLQAVSISGEGSKAFEEALINAIIHIFMVLTGSAGTIGAGGATGVGPYQPQKGGAWAVRHDLIARPTVAIVRSINQGHVKPFVDHNFFEAVNEEKATGTWTDPVLSIPLPAPDRDERIDSVIKREEARTAILQGRRDAGILVTQDDAHHLADDLEVRRVTLADQGTYAITKDDMAAKVFAPDEVRARYGYAPLPGGAGSVERLARERLAGADEIGGAPAPPPSPTEAVGRRVHRPRASPFTLTLAKE